MRSIEPRTARSGAPQRGLMTGATLRIAFYVRVSSEEQTERATAKNQTEFLTKKYQPNFDMDSLEPMAFVGAFVDDGQSGAIALADRPDGRRLLDLVRARGVDVVVCYRLDRLGRRLGVLLDIHAEFQRYDVAILSATEPFDTRTPIGQFLFQLLGSIAELERETIRERFTMGRDRIAREGKFNNGPVPIGYDVVDQRLVPSERLIPQLGCTEAELIGILFERAAAGESLPALIVWLRARGVPSTKRYIRRDGGETEENYPEWNAARLQKVIHAPMYHGERRLKYAGGVVRQETPALVSRELWDRANAAIASRVSSFNSGQNDGYVYLLSGKLFCASCDHRMLGNYQVASQWHSKPRMYYVCSLAKAPRGRRSETNTCEAKRNHNGYAVEALVLEAIDEFVANPDAALKILRDQARQRSGASVEQDEQVKLLRTRLAAYERGKVALLGLVGRGQLSEDDYLTQAAEAAAEASAVRRDLEVLEAQGAVGAVLETRLLESVRVLQQLREHWPQARAEDDRVALRGMVQGTLREMRLTADGEARITFAFTAPSTEKNQSHYHDLYLDDSRPTLSLGLSINRSLLVRKSA